MAKIISKADLTLGTNLKLHITDKGATDIAISKSGSVLTITTSTANFTGSSETEGIVNKAISNGDVIKLSHTGNALNEGVTATVTAVSSTSITATIVTGTGATESAGADINITTFKKTFQFLAAGALSFVDGVQGIVLASKLVDLWDSSDLDKYDSAFASIEPRAKSIAAINGWEGHDSSTINAIRDTAMEIRPSKTGTATKIYALFRSTSNAHAGTDQMVLWPATDAEMTAPTAFVMAGYANQLALLYDYNGGTPIDNRGTWYTRLAVEGKTIIMETHTANYAEIYPISAANAIDPKLTVPDATVAAGGIYANIDFNMFGTFTGITATLSTGTANVTVTDTTNLRAGMYLTKTSGAGAFGASAYILSITNATDFVASINNATAGAITFSVGVNGLEAGLVDGVPYSFSGHIDGDTQTNESVHAKINYLWRQASNVNSDAGGPTKRGDKQFPLTTFSGDVFTIKSYINSYKASQRNNLRLIDSGATTRQWPAIYTLTVTSPALAVGGTFSLIHNDSYGTAGATYLKNEATTDQKDITITSSTDIVVAYSTYTTGGHTANTPLELRLTWNRPNFVEPDSAVFTLGASNLSVAISPTADPSYTVA